MSAPFTLGQKVRASATVQKTYPGDGALVWVSDPLAEPVEGIVTGYRWVSDGAMVEDNEYGDYGMVLSRSRYFVSTPGTSRRYWIVVTNLRRAPLHVPDDGIEEVG